MDILRLYLYHGDPDQSHCQWPNKKEAALSGFAGAGGGLAYRLCTPLAHPGIGSDIAL